MSSPLAAVLDVKALSVGLLLAAAAGLAYLSTGRIDPEAIEAAARHPAPVCPPEWRPYRFPAPDAYPLEGYPWIKSRQDLIAYHTQGEDPDTVRRYCEGPEEELIEYLGEAYSRSVARPRPGVELAAN